MQLISLKSKGSHLKKFCQTSDWKFLGSVLAGHFVRSKPKPSSDSTVVMAHDDGVMASE